MSAPLLLAVPNVSEGSRPEVVAAIGGAITRADGPEEGSARLLDVHFDRDHDRSVYTLAARQGVISEAMLRLAGEAVRRIDVVAGTGGQHPHVGALDVAPVVYLRPEDRGAACAEALVIAERIGTELEVPVFLYGELTGDGARPARTRHELRRGGPAVLAQRLRGEGTAAAPGEPPLRPDFGPAELHPTAGATLVAARPPLVAFNLQLAPPATLADASRIAVQIREGGEQGMPGLRAIAVDLHGVPQVSMNVERPFELALAEIVRAVARHAPIASAQLVGLAPKAAFEGFPAEIPIPGFDPERHLIENALGA